MLKQGLEVRLSFRQFFFFTFKVSIIIRDVDNIQEPGKLPGCEPSFSGFKSE